MSELNVLAFALFLRAVCVCVAIGGVVYLAYNDKPGWGWLIFLAICLAGTSYKYTPDGVSQ